MRAGFAAATSALLIGLTAEGLAQPAPTLDSGVISGLGSRNIGSAAMSGRISALAGYREPSGSITLVVGSASGGVWKSTDSGTTFKPVFDEQSAQSIGAFVGETQGLGTGTEMRPALAVFNGVLYAAWKGVLPLSGDPESGWPLMRELKRALDPQNLLNPHKFVG